jgi:predicted Zn-dependent protease
VKAGFSGLATLLMAASALAQTPPAAKPPAPAGPDPKAIAAMIEKGDLAPAEERLRRFLAQGGSPIGHDLLGTVLAAQGRGGEAEHEFKQALLGNPSLLDARQHLARLYLGQKREADAASELRRAAALGPLDRDLALTLAEVERAAGRPLPAERQLRSVADRFKSVRALLQLAQLQSEQKNATGALASLRQARALAPDSEDVLRAYAEALLASPTPDAAIPILGALTRMYPLEGRYQYLEGVAVLGAGDARAAVSFLQEAMRLEPDQAPTLIALGRALNQEQLYAEAKPHLIRGLSLLPGSVLALAALAEAEQGLGELDNALEHARRALAQVKDHPTASVVVALVLMKQEKLAEARDVLLKAAAADPSSPAIHYQLSLAYERLGDPTSARKHRALYDQKLEEGKARLKQARQSMGFMLGGR